MTSFRIGPFLFTWVADGDDDGVGWMRVVLDGQADDIACSREQWDEFAAEAGP